MTALSVILTILHYLFFAGSAVFAGIAFSIWQYDENPRDALTTAVVFAIIAWCFA